MGNTHFWAYLPESEQFQAAFPRLLADTRLILEHLSAHGIRTAGSDGHGSPRLEPTLIVFNGATPADRGEPFILSTHQDAYTRIRADTGESFSWDYCATDHRDYDLAVTAVLLRARQLAPWHFAINSTAAWDTDWLAARTVIGALFEPFTEPNPLLRDTFHLGPRILRTQPA